MEFVSELNAQFVVHADEKLFELADLIKADLEWLQSYTRAAIGKQATRWETLICLRIRLMQW